MASAPRKILFVAECVTLAHMARPCVLAGMLPRANYEVIFAADGRFDDLFPEVGWQREKLFSIGSEQFISALAKGKPVYNRATLRRYVEDELALFASVKPDLVVGDFRLSLSISARLAKIPYAAISNIYWSPYVRQRYPIPRLPITRLMGVTFSQAVFDLLRPIIFALHSVPLNKVRKQFGLESLGADLRRTYTDADITLYADIPGLFQTVPLPTTHRFIGPLLWSPQVPLPDWWGVLDEARPIIYLTPGSSGAADKLMLYAAALASLPANVLVATAGRCDASVRTPGVFVADFLPGEQVANKADVVVCNGGSPTTGQALAAGVPVIGIPTNLDQYLNMGALADSGLGITLRSETLTPERLSNSVREVLEKPGYRERAGDIQRRINAIPVRKLFIDALAQLN